MKSIIFISAVAAAAMSFSSLSFAQDHQGERHGRGAERAQAHQGQRVQEPVRQQQFQPRNWQAQAQAPQYQNRAPQIQNRAAQIQNRNWQAQAPQYQQRSNNYAWQQQRNYAAQAQWNGYYQRGDWARVPHYRRGEVLPWQYRQRPYYVSDWRAYHLYAPPYGYQWVEDDSGDFLLVAIATGLIANLLLSSY